MSSDATMRAAVMHGHGGPEQLVVHDDWPRPVPGDGQVLVQVRAAAVNNTDLWTRQGAYGSASDPDAVAGWLGVPIEVPRIQGADVCGVVVDGPPELVGRRVLVDPGTYASDDVDAIPVAVMGSEYDGGFAEFVAVDASAVYDVSASPLSDEQLACLPIAYGTAMGMLERAEVAAKETIVVTGASGGVGLALVQLAAARLATVIAVCSSSASSTVLAAGATAVVERDRVDDVTAAIVDAAGRPADVVADVVGGPGFGAVLASLREQGRLVIAGAIGGPVVQIDLRPLYLRQLRLIGSTMHTRAHFATLVAAANAGTIAPIVAATFPLESIHEAQTAFSTSRAPGKLVLVA
jgi:NADPH:quinone reductase-like Zn-dependent oxidoreductase